MIWTPRAVTWGHRTVSWVWCTSPSDLSPLLQITKTLLATLTDIPSARVSADTVCTQVCRKTTTTPKQKKACGQKRSKISSLCGLLTPKSTESGLTNKQKWVVSTVMYCKLLLILLWLLNHFHIYYIVFLCFWADSHPTLNKWLQLLHSALF